MCGRYQTTKVAQEIEKIFDAKIDKKIYKQNYNAAPTQELPLIANNKPNEVQFFKWGLIPVWAKELKSAKPMSIARLDTITEKTSFKNLINTKRCAVISDGYYEWPRVNNPTKQPVRIFKKDNGLFAFAGIWNVWKSPDNNLISSFAIITTEPHKSIEHIHERMPVMLHPELVNRWILNEIELTQLQKEMMQNEDIDFYAVSNRVNYTKNNTPDLLEKAPTDLFG